MRQLKSAVNALTCSKSFFINHLASLHWMRLDYESIQLVRELEGCSYGEIAAITSIPIWHRHVLTLKLPKALAVFETQFSHNLLRTVTS